MMRMPIGLRLGPLFKILFDCVVMTADSLKIAPRASSSSHVCGHNSRHEAVPTLLENSIHTPYSSGSGAAPIHTVCRRVFRPLSSAKNVCRSKTDIFSGSKGKVCQRAFAAATQFLSA